MFIWTIKEIIIGLIICLIEPWIILGIVYLVMKIKDHLKGEEVCEENT